MIDLQISKNQKNLLYHSFEKKVPWAINEWEMGSHGKWKKVEDKNEVVVCEE
jgi:hypothetical protein